MFSIYDEKNLVMYTAEAVTYGVQPLTGLEWNVLKLIHSKALKHICKTNVLV